MGALRDIPQLRIGLILLVVCLAAFMGSLDVSIVLIALPSITRYFDVSTSVSTWIILSYGLVMTSFMLIFGKLGDRLGFRNIFLTGFILFTISSLMCGLAATMTELIICRIVQGLGAAMLAALGPAMISSYLPEARRGVGLGYVTTFSSLGLAVGPVIGGLLVQNLDWRWIFLINVPVGAIALIASYVVIPKVRALKHEAFDVTGALLALLMLFAIIFCLNMGKELGWYSPLILGSAVASVTLTFLFTRHMKRAANPLLDLKVLSNRNIRWANWSSLLILAVSSGAFVLLPFYFQYVKGMSVEDTGFALMVPSLAMAFAGPVAGYLSDRRGSRPVCAVACMIMGSAFLMLSKFQVDTSPAFIVAGLIALGFSLDMFLAPNHSLVLGHTPERSRGTSSALMMTMQDTGEVLGVVIFETIFSQFIVFDGDWSTSAGSGIGGLIPGFEAAFLSAAFLCVVALLLASRARDPARKASPDIERRDDVRAGI